MRTFASPGRVAAALVLAACLVHCNLFARFNDCQTDRECPRGQVCNVVRHFCQTDTAEICGNGVDDDQDGLNDSNDEFGACEVSVQPGMHACRDGVWRCQSGALTCRQRTTPLPMERCNDGIDDDCNGIVDDSDACMSNYAAVASGSPMQLGTGSENPDDGPAHDVCLAAFKLDRFEVTVEAYSRFLNSLNPDQVAVGVPAPENSGLTAEHFILVGPGGGQKPYVRLPPDAQDNRSIELSPSEGWRPIDRSAHGLPMLNVTWYGAQAYCVWAGKHLPSEAEWWRATHSANGQRTYPWGSGPLDCAHANLGTGGSAREGSCVGGPSPVDSLAVGANPEQAQGLVGNASEWTFDWLQDTPDRMQNSYFATPPTGGWCSTYPDGPLGPDAGSPLGTADAGYTCLHCKFTRGGDYATPEARANARLYSDPDRTSDTIGFRCAMGGVAR
jgi:formylglycine-generating enzyme required for sulfatase activity